MDDNQNTAQDLSCKTPRWRILKTQLNNLTPTAFVEAYEQSEHAVLIDVRKPAEFENIKLDEAININYFDAALIEQLEALKEYDDFFVYCRSGRRSIRVCTLMKNGDFEGKNIYNMDGGLVAMGLL